MILKIMLLSIGIYMTKRLNLAGQNRLEMRRRAIGCLKDLGYDISITAPEAQARKVVSSAGIRLNPTGPSFRAWMTAVVDAVADGRVPRVGPPRLGAYKRGISSEQAKIRIKKKPKIEPNKPKLEPWTPEYVERAKEFYSSYDWRSLRYKVFLRDGRVCALCRTSEGVILHVDHIIPLRRDWGRRLDINNLQVLCEACNHGKGSMDTTDWRAPQPVQMAAKFNYEKREFEDKAEDGKT